MVLCMPETENDYDPVMPLPPTPVSADEDPFEDEEEPNEEEQPGDEIGGVPVDSSPYPDSFSHQNTHEEDPNESDSSLGTVAPPSPSPLSIHTPGCMIITTPRKSIHIPSHKRVTSPPSSPNPSKKPRLTHKWTPHVDEWIHEDNIGFYEVGESSQAPTGFHPRGSH